MFGSWRQSEGLPQDSIFSIIQSQQGYFWMGGKGGLTRFDGVRFTVFDDRDPQQLRDNEVWSVAEGKDGSIWATTYGGGVSRYRNGRFTLYSETQGLISDYVTIACPDSRGGVWLGTDRGLSYLRDDHFTNFTVQQGLPGNVVRALYEDKDGSIWIGTNAGGIARYAEGRLEIQRYRGPTLTSEVRWFWRAGDGALWIATFEGLARAEHGSLVLYTTADGLASNRLRQIVADPEKGIWLVGGRGLDRMTWDGRKPAFEHVLADRSAMTFCFDHEGSLWVGTFLEGLVRLRRGVFSEYTEADGLAGPYVGAIVEDRAGAIWFAARNGVSRFKSGRFTSYGQESGVPKATLYALLEDHLGHLWVGSDSGVYRSAAPVSGEAAAGKPRFLPVTSPSTPRAYARALFEDRNGNVWIGMDQEGLARWKDGEIRSYTVKDGLANNSVRALAQTRDGALWIGTRGGGLSRLQDGRFETYAVQQGLAGIGVQALYIDGDDTLWIATRQGLSRYRDGRFTTYTVRDGLFTNYAYSVTEDGLGHLWMGSAKGVFRLSKKELDDFAARRSSAVRSEAYGLEYGWRSQPVAGSAPASCRTRDGLVWFATTTGANVLNPRQLHRNLKVPPVHIEAVTIDGVAYDPGSVVVRAPAGRGDVVLRYTALSFMAPEKVHFKYRLEGYDTGWIDAETRRVAYYTNIPPGPYNFHVKASNNDGVWNEEGTAVEIRLAAHVYQTYWFYGLCIAGIAAFGAASQRLRVKRMQIRERELQKRVEDALGQVKTLRGLLPICAACKKIRDDKGYWNQMETYIHEHSEADFSHGICPECLERLYPEYTVRRSRGNQD